MKDNMQIQKGIYQHYKGNFYEVIEVAKHSETGEDFVVYKQKYEDESVWIRPLKMFTENVIVNGKEVPRFKLVKNIF